MQLAGQCSPPWEGRLLCPSHQQPHLPEGSMAGDATKSPVGRRCWPFAHTGGVMAAGAAPTAAVSGVGDGAPSAATAREGSAAGTTLLRPGATCAAAPPAAALVASASAAALEDASWYHSLGGRIRMATSSPSIARFCNLKPCRVGWTK